MPKAEFRKAERQKSPIFAGPNLSKSYSAAKCLLAKSRRKSLPKNCETIKVSVVNSSPLIVLGKAGCLDLLSRLAGLLVVPAAVIREVTVRRGSLVNSLS